MTIFERWKNRDNGGGVPVVAPSLPFHARMEEWLDIFSRLTKISGWIISTEVFSELRLTHDYAVRVKELAKEGHRISPEQEYLIESSLCSYLPSALSTFERLPTGLQAPGGEADSLLLAQCVKMRESMKSLKSSLESELMRDLNSQALFVEERFNSLGM